MFTGPVVVPSTCLSQFCAAVTEYHRRVICTEEKCIGAQLCRLGSSVSRCWHLARAVCCVILWQRVEGQKKRLREAQIHPFIRNPLPR
jgi:hypothetical protein